MKTSIVPYNYDDDLEVLQKDGVAIGIEEMSITYVQLPDSNSSPEEYQHLTITSRTICSPSKEDTDKQEGYYFDITIPEGEHWSINDGNELSSIIKDFKKRLYLESKY